MAFNPLQSYLSGQQAGQQQQAQDISGRLAQSDQPMLEPEFQRLLELDPARAKQIMEVSAGGDALRSNAQLKDAKTVKYLLGINDYEGVNSLLGDRTAQLGGRTAVDTDAVKGFMANQDYAGAMNAVDSYINLFDPNAKQTGAPSVQSSKILEDGTIIQVLKNGSRQVTSSSGEMLQGDAAREAVKLSSQQSFNRKKELARLGQTIKREQAKEGLLTDQQTAIQRQNIQRLGALSGTSTGRNAAVKKASKFKLALETGEAFSGAGRRAATFIPGVFTSQGEFDEEFNAFAEVAARQQLKASGETRPTDADVQGMKNAMFGLGRDEDVNVQLLGDFIKDQLAQTQELDQLIDASGSGNLSSFTFTNATTQQGKPLEDMTIEELQALRAQGGR
jgi:hypothetical protein